MNMSGSTPSTGPEHKEILLVARLPVSPIHVAVAAIIDSTGRVLLAHRSPGRHQGGLWEFPGGKLEAGESVEAALARELDEELAITPQQMRPLIRIPYRYPEYDVLLDVWRVDRFSGEPHGREGQPIEWVAIDRLCDYPLPAANVPIVTALQLPMCYLVTGDYLGKERFLASLRHALERGIRLVQLRLTGLGETAFRSMAVEALACCRNAGARLLLNCEPELASELGADGVHLTSQRLMSQRSRPLGPERLVAASCHNEQELQQAAAIGVDFALLSPVNPTTTHPEVKALGWDRFAELVDGCAIPVYALGGVGEGDLEQAFRHGAQGVAAIRAFWE